jgi:hypothetical protein
MGRGPTVGAARQLALLLCACIGALAACEKKQAKEKLYFPDLKPPVGVQATVISDVGDNAESGTSITTIVAVEPDIDRDDLDQLIETFSRQVNDRGGFRKGAADRVEIRFYAGQAKAAAGGGDWLAQVLRQGRDAKETRTNKQKYPLVKWAKKALGPQPQFSGKLQPELLADSQNLALELKVPFVKDDGSGAYIDAISFVTIVKAFSFYMRALFDKIEPLRKVTYVGIFEDREVAKIWMTREQYQQLDLRLVEEGLGAFQGKFINLLMTKEMTSEQVEKKVNEQTRKVYRETFARLPEGQVAIDKTIK